MKTVMHVGRIALVRSVNFFFQLTLSFGLQNQAMRVTWSSVTVAWTVNQLINIHIIKFRGLNFERKLSFLSIV